MHIASCSLLAALIAKVPPFYDKDIKSYESNDMFLIGGGPFDVCDRRDLNPNEIRMEYIWGNPFFWRLKPIVGMIVTDRKDFYPYASFICESDLFQKFSFATYFGVGYYQKENGFSLGTAVNFKTQMDLWWAIKSNFKLGIGFSHLSHANIGSRYNPGQESLVIQFKISL